MPYKTENYEAIHTDARVQVTPANGKTAWTGYIVNVNERGILIKPDDLLSCVWLSIDRKSEIKPI